MAELEKSVDNLVYQLKERAKELSCLYQVEELFTKSDATLEEICHGIIYAIPPGWQYPDICQAEIILGNDVYRPAGFVESAWVLSAEIVVQEMAVGKINVYYTQERPVTDEGPFLKEERKLINTIAQRLGRRLLHQQLKEVFEQQKDARPEKGEWQVILDLLHRTDPKLLLRISRKMTNNLCWSGIEEGERLLQLFNPVHEDQDGEVLDDLNRPHQKKTLHDFLSSSEEIFRVASKYLSEKEIVSNIQKWIKEEKSGFLVSILENPGSSLAEINSAIERYHHLAPQGVELSTPREKGFRVSLIRRLLTDQPQYINIAKHYVEVNDFYELLHKVIYPAGSHGKLGGKSSGLFLASQVLKRTAPGNPLLQDIKTPKTWYLTSDGILNFMHYNNLEDVVEQKYKEIGQIRQEYPFVIQVFKNAQLPPEIVKGLSLALDDFGDAPLIVRSSSLLEDRMGTAFAGKYKSLFIANQGSKEQRLAALMDAIAEVYASTFGPDPIEYRIERGLLDFHEEMGVMIQEVVGARVGNYFLPAFAGVAFSHNDFRWSSRIKREDGLVRMVPGLGTRAVDRLSDDYPVLIAPGQPGLRVNVTPDEIIHYSPKKIDVINLKSNRFETITIRELIREYGQEYPVFNQVFSALRHHHIQQLMSLGADFKKEDFVATFDGLFTRTQFLKKIHAILKDLQDTMATPVDIEFAHDGKDFYLLQCRPQSYGDLSKPASIPREVPKDRIIFSARRYVSNGSVPDITHVVYVDPQKYSDISEHSDLLAVGRAVGQLNQLLPKRQFILMGPGRWGSRGDIKLGVNVTYSDINNTAMLIEIARKHKNYLPEVSFGTHFFQDLVEASIRYLPVYPDDKDIVFNEEFLTHSPNTLPEMLPEFAHLEQTVKVIDISASASGLILKVYMNADLDEAVGILTKPTGSPETILREPQAPASSLGAPKSDTYWRWRQRMAEHLASMVEPDRFGVKGFYLFGSTKNATAGPESDIDILIHFQGSAEQRRELLTWLEGWSKCLSAVNFGRTGFRTDGLLDVHIVTDEDIKNRNSYAIKIGAVTDAARPLPMGRGDERK
ncbi:MAG: nucleotidyltransferase domain-containing protein [Calditrichaceae bacterium]|nr:nucleotidyltransferase domain-containing protein [Calditrichia bacterium]NUQ43783.1 nucleotidyltransferase domain-containing protein [Calditrichaceae bacterium]